MDRAITELIRESRIPGGAVAVTYRSRLVYARGFGYADTATRRPVEPTSLFRIASLSKPITAVAVMTLVEAGVLELDDPAFARLAPSIQAPSGTTPHPRLGSISVAQLLTHSGGWDSNLSGEPFEQSRPIAAALGIPGPPTAAQLVGYLMGRPLDFDPGTRYVYANIGFTVVGRVIEHIAGEDYQTFVRAMLARAGIGRMILARTRLADRHPDEVRYYDLASVPSVFPTGGLSRRRTAGFTTRVSTPPVGGSPRWSTWPGSSPRSMASPAGPISSDQRLGPRCWPHHPGSGTGRPTTTPSAGWFGPDRATTGTTATSPGTASFAARLGDDLTIAAVFNARAMTPASPFELLIEPALGAGLQVSRWPTHDLFPTFP
jgi:N-acyl-D-amino-acid deacylase